MATKEELELQKRKLELELELADADETNVDVVQPEVKHEPELEGFKGFVQATFPTFGIKGIDAHIDAPQSQPATPEQINAMRTQGMAYQDPAAQKLAGQAFNVAGQAIKGAILDPLDAMRRGLGAAAGEVPIIKDLVGREEGQSFLQAYADEKTGLFKRVKEAVERSDASAATKILADVGLSVAEDPLTFLTGIYTFGRGLTAQGIKSAARTATKEAGVELAPEIVAKATIPEIGVIPTDTRAKGLSFTPAQQKIVAGENVSDKELLKEHRMFKSAKKIGDDVNAELKQGNVEAITQKLSDLTTKHNLESGNAKAYRRSAEEKIGVLREDFENEYKGIYEGIRKRADEFGGVAGEAKTSVDDAVNRIYQAEPIITPSTPEEFRKLLEEGKLTIGSNGRATIEGTASKTAEDLGVKQSTLNRINGIKKRIDTGVKTGKMKFSDLMEERTNLGKVIWDKNTQHETPDYEALKDMYKGLTDAMASHLEKATSPELYQEWKKANEAFGLTKGDFDYVQKVFKNKTPDNIVSNLSKAPRKDKDIGIKSLVRVMPEENFDTFRNMYFNDIIKRSTVGGQISSQKLLGILREQPPSVFNDVFIPEMSRDLADLAKDAMAKEMAQSLPKVTRDPKPVLSRLANNPFGRYLLMGRGFSLKKMAMTEGGRAAIQSWFRQKAGATAADYLRQVDEESLIPIMFKGAKGGIQTGTKLQIGQELIKNRE